MYPQWKSWKFVIDIKLLLRNNENSENSFTIKMSLGHVFILLKDSQLMLALLKSEPNHLYWIHATVEITNNGIKGKDAWLNNANCLHFASRFNPESLHLILSFFELQGTKEILIQETHRDGIFSPLHCASFQPESIGTRYTMYRPMTNPGLDHFRIFHSISLFLAF